jgi:predicted signal transduction protein with EAL and GGDEF domain
LTAWLIDPGRKNLPDSIRIQLFRSLYGTLPIFLGGVINTLLVALAIATRHPTPLFIARACFEMLLALVRAPVLIAGRRAIARGRRGPGMVGGICFRNFAAPRLAAVMIVLSLGPCAAGGILSGEPILMVTAIQIPLDLFAMSVAAFKLNRMLLDRMEAELEKDHRVRHDGLTGLVNRAGLATALDRRVAAGEATRSPICSSTWTASSGSTTRSATAPATGCWSRSPRGCVASRRRRTSSRGSAATSS